MNEPSPKPREAHTHRSGTAKFGKRNHSALTIAVLPGILTAVAIGGLRASIGEHPSWIWTAAVVTLIAAPISTGLIWAAIVDRTTVPGPKRSYENNIESRWYDLAAKRTCFSTCIIAGIAAALTTNVRTDLPAVSLTLLAVSVLMVVIFAVSYLLEKNRGQ